MGKYFDLAADWREVVMEAIRPEIKRKAEAGLEAARQVAPVVTGDYKKSLSLEETPGGYALNAGVDYALIVEYGSAKTTKRKPGHRVLGHAADVIKRS